MNPLQTTTSVDSEKSMLLQRQNAFCIDEQKLSALMLFSQIWLCAALYLFPTVSTPGYLALLIVLPILVLGFFAGRGAAVNVKPFSMGLGKILGRATGVLAALSFFIDAEYALWGIEALVKNILPDTSDIAKTVLLFFTCSFSLWGNQPHAMSRMAGYLLIPLSGMILVCALSTVPDCSIETLFPFLGAGMDHLLLGVLSLSGVLGCVVLAPFLPDIQAAKEKWNVPLSLSGWGLGFVALFVCALLYPFSSLMIERASGERLMLLFGPSSSILIWSICLFALLFFFLITYTGGIVRCGKMLCEKGIAPNWLLEILLFLTLLIPILIPADSLSAVLAYLFPYRSILWGTVILLSLFGRLKAKGKEKRA